MQADKAALLRANLYQPLSFPARNQRNAFLKRHLSDPTSGSSSRHFHPTRTRQYASRLCHQSAIRSCEALSTVMEMAWFCGYSYKWAVNTASRSELFPVGGSELHLSLQTVLVLLPVLHSQSGKELVQTLAPGEKG